MAKRGRPKRATDEALRRVVVSVTAGQFRELEALARRRYRSGEGTLSRAEATRLVLARGMEALGLSPETPETSEAA